MGLFNRSAKKVNMDLLNGEQRSDLSDIVVIEEAMAQRRKDWVRSHQTLLFTIAGAIIVAIVFLGIKIYNDHSNPMTQLLRSSANNLSSSFSFEISAAKNGDTMMEFEGEAGFNTSAQRLEIEYRADYNDYQYRNVIYTHEGTTYKGNYYNGQWTIADHSEKAADFFDFMADYKKGNFDGNAFLRFIGYNTKYSGAELTSFLDTLRSRMSTNSSIAQISTVNDGGAVTYDYTISLPDIVKLIEEQGASVFLRSTDYDNFIAKIKQNTDNIDRAECKLSFTVTSGGNLSNLKLTINTGTDTYVIQALMSDFGSAEVNIPEDFFEAAAIINH